MRAFYETRSETYFVGGMTNYPFPLHVHEIVELTVVTEGECVMQLDGRSYRLSAGDAAIAFPLTPHGFDEIGPGTRGLAAFFPADIIAEYAHIFHTLLPDEPVVRDLRAEEDVVFAVRRMLAIPENTDSPLRLAYLHLLLAHILDRLQYHPATDYRERGLGARIIRYVYDHACEDITISSTARHLGISESHLSHLFAQQFQVNFRRFINAIRIDRAVMLMRDPYLTLTQICDQCGFENMRTFRRAFVRETGVLPAAYMRTAKTNR